jgi:hypothetical protein
MSAGEKVKHSELDLVSLRARGMEFPLKIVRAVLRRNFGVNIEGGCI